MKKLISKEEKDLLIKERIKRVDNNQRHALDLFKVWYSENPKENYLEWKTLDYDKKYKLIKDIVAKEHKEILRVSLQTHKLNLNQGMRMADNLINDQLIKFNIRK